MVRALFVLLGSLLYAGCSSGPRIEVPALDPVAAGTEAMALFDENKDGSIAGGELDKAPGLKAAMAATDRDKNGAVSQAEVVGRLQKYQAEELAVMPFSCIIRLDGKPLGDAEVRLAPEKFMGPATKPAAGKTTREGAVSPKVEIEGLFGMHCGMYRVEISKKNAAGQEMLPAKYNTQTTLGQEVAPDMLELEHGVVWELSTR